MQLSAGMYQEILRSLRSDAQREQERRKYPRVGLRAKVTLISIDPDGCAGTPHTVWVRDISDGGIGLVVTRPMKRGELFVVVLVPDGQQRICILCQTTQCRPTDLLMGARIIRELTPAECVTLARKKLLTIDLGKIPNLI